MSDEKPREWTVEGYREFREIVRHDLKDYRPELNKELEAFFMPRDNGMALLDAYDQLKAHAERLAEALDWYWLHWGTNNYELKAKGYSVSKEALAEYRQKYPKEG